MTNSLHQEPERDHFKNESPIRAFTDWKVEGDYAVGKGFRPSLQHTVTYLNAMERKEGWRLVQVLEAGTQTPSFLFRRSDTLTADALVSKFRNAYPVLRSFAEDDPWVDPKTATLPEVYSKITSAQDAAGALQHHGPALTVNDDPVNPKHYKGRNCADIGERLSANGYQILKYCWRLGKKDDPCQELGKALWYLDSEEALFTHKPVGHHIFPDTSGLKKPLDFVNDRLTTEPDFTQIIARSLWAGYNAKTICNIRAKIADEKTLWDCGRTLAI